MRLLIVGGLNGQIGAATKIAMDRGAKVTHAVSIEQALDSLRGGAGADLVFCDVTLDISALVKGLAAERICTPVVACGIGTDTRRAVDAIRAGAKEYLPLPADAELIAAVLAAVADESHQLVHEDEAMTAVLSLADQIAGSEASILITGESGTGKEVLARYVHRKSMRNDKPFISVNCAAIPENLLESELFGHEKGAFTGAIARRIGKFEEANGGTLLLDEISEMDARLQAKLLRAIQEREIDRVGGTKPVKVDIRIIATSNRDLAEAVKHGTFREDLLYRLNVVNLRIPALRERPKDIRALAHHFARKYAEANGVPYRPHRHGHRKAAAEPWLARQCARTGKYHPSRRSAGPWGGDFARSHPPAGRQPCRRQHVGCRHSAGFLGAECGGQCRGGDARPGGPHGFGCRTRPDPGHAGSLPGQSHPCRQHLGHLDPHPAQQAARIFRLGAFHSPAWRTEAGWVRRDRPADRFERRTHERKRGPGENTGHLDLKSIEE